jgi:hypothetical protein
MIGGTIKEISGAVAGGRDRLVFDGSSEWQLGERNIFQLPVSCVCGLGESKD